VYMVSDSEPAARAVHRCRRRALRMTLIGTCRDPE
jgi:hypothetical protein